MDELGMIQIFLKLQLYNVSVTRETYLTEL